MAYGYGSLVPAAPVIILPVFSTLPVFTTHFTLLQELVTLLEGSKVARAREG